jgi:hypothetical protein
VLENTQSELLPLEEGMHAVNSPLSEREYVAVTGGKLSTLRDKVCAAKVAQAVCAYAHKDLAPHWRALTAIHVAKQWLWKELVDTVMVIVP